MACQGPAMVVQLRTACGAAGNWDRWGRYLEIGVQEEVRDGQEGHFRPAGEVDASLVATV